MEGVMMRSTVLILLLCIAASGAQLAGARVVPRHRRSPDFISLSCQSTRYPAVCVQSLAAYAPAVRRSPRQLARAALTVSAARASDASAFVAGISGRSKAPRGQGGGAVRDCAETLADSVERLRRSSREMERMGRRGSARFRWHLGNAQTWVSAALTDQGTCLESLSEDARSAAVRAPIRARIVAVSQTTSNALALLNRLQ